MVRISILCLVMLFAACAQRGTLTLSDRAGTGASVVEILVATNRLPISQAPDFGSGRAEGTYFAEYSVSIPASHEPGLIEWSGSDEPDPDKSFVVADSAVLTKSDFAASVSRRARSPGNHSPDVVLFVHGYNSNFAESLFRFAQMAHDFETGGINVLYTWPSAGNARGYVHDRDSVELARDNLQDVLETLQRTNARTITIVGHSLGSLLVMETLRQMAIEGKMSMGGKLSAVALISPDIDIDLFKSQVNRIGKLPEPFIVFVNNEDKALRLSTLLSQGESRLGLVSNLEEISESEITVINVTDINDDGGGSNHFTVATSPFLISMFTRFRVLREVSAQNLSPDALRGFGDQKVVDQVREIRL